MSEIKTLKDLLIDELKDLYDAENQLLKALPKLAKATKRPELEQAFESHLEETKAHVDRLESAFEHLGVFPKRKTCHAMKGLVEEGSEAISTKAPDSLHDANLIGAAQRVEHYEIAAYGTAHAFAKKLGEDEVATLLEQNLEEERAADRKLTEISDAVNLDAMLVGSAGGGVELE